MSKQEFDPEKVQRWDTGIGSTELTPAYVIVHPNPQGAWVLAGEYDRLLALYREAIKPKPMVAFEPTPWQEPGNPPPWWKVPRY